MRLEGAKIIMLIADGYHEHEFWFPYYRFKEEGAGVIVAGIAKGTVAGEGRHGRDGLPAEVTHTVEEVAGNEFDCLYLPGGIYGPLALKAHVPAQKLVQRAMREDRIVAAICHAHWLLVSADVLKGRRVTSPRDIAIDMTNAGAEYVDGVEAVQDGNLHTAVYFGYLPEQFRLLIPAIAARLK